MALVVISTPGAVNANSFQSVSEIDDYFLARVPNSVAQDWLGADAPDKDAAAVMATTQMTALICWTGYPTSTDQALPWPRNSMLTKEGLSFIDSGSIPRELKNAHAELARLLLLSDRLAERSQDMEGLASLKAGPVTLSFRNASGKGSSTPPRPVIPDYIISMLPENWIDDVDSGYSSEIELLRS